MKKIGKLKFAKSVKKGPKIKEAKIKEPKVKKKRSLKVDLNRVKRSAKTKSIKRTLLFGMVSLTVGISIICGVAAGLILYQNTYNSMQDEVSMASKGYSLAVQNKLQQYKMGIEQIAANKEITDTTISEAGLQSVKAKLAGDYGFDEIHVVDYSGKDDDGANESDSEFFLQASVGKTYISVPRAQSSGNQDIVIYVATKINNLTGYNGVVYGILKGDTLSTMVADATVGKTGYSFITDKTGTIIAHKDANIVNNFTNYIDEAKKNPVYNSVSSIIQAMTKGKSGTSAYTLNGKEMFMSYRPIVGTDGWSIGSTANVSEMMNGFYNSILITALLIVFFIIISCVLSIRVANPIARPIVSLVQRIEKLAEGDLHSEIPEIKSKDEIGVLAASFASTVHTLQGYVGEISTVLGSLADGDCTVETNQNYKGDFVEIGTALNTHITSLNHIFTNINESADQVASGASQVSSASQALSQGATEQASSIEELSATITNIASEVGKNATNAASANQLSLTASNEVQRGNEHMQQMISAMKEISSSSNEIGKIIKTIEDIAFQTNILALNAAVEAARAGAAGKGFAVVADEVRNLASKSAEAAKNTTVLIENSIHAVDNGTATAEATAESLNVIIESVKKTTDLISEISTASNGQATSINQVMQGVDQISAVVQTNSATSEESAATSEELSAQAQTLKEMLSVLKLMDVSGAAASSAFVQNTEDADAFRANPNMENSKY